MLPQGMFSVAVATVLFPALSRLAARGDLDGFRDTVALGLRQIAFLLVPAERRVGRPGRADRPARSTSAARSSPTRRRSSRARSPRSRSASTFNGMMLMLNRGFFSLQSPWTPTWVALGSLVAQRRALRRALPGRHVGDPARDLAREHRRRGRAARRCCARRLGRLDFGRHGAHARPRDGRLGRARRRGRTRSGASSTTRSGRRSAPSSSRSGRRSRGRRRLPDFLPFAGSS